MPGFLDFRSLHRDLRPEHESAGLFMSMISARVSRSSENHVSTVGEVSEASSRKTTVIDAEGRRRHWPLELAVSGDVHLLALRIRRA